MRVIMARNVNQALHIGIDLINQKGVELPSRGGRILEMPTPVTTAYYHPWERVLFGNVRDANPFFHLFESLWILAGRNDTEFLCEFNKRMGEYSDNGVEFNAPYGFRMREYWSHDQIEEAIEILKNDPDSRQVVLQIWDEEDLTKQTKDKACNMSVLFRKREGMVVDMTVYNRSNDMIWGAYGANYVQFTMLMEYVCAKAGLHMGIYYQVSNSFHVYLDGPGGELWHKLKTSYRNEREYEGRPEIMPGKCMMGTDMGLFDTELDTFFRLYDEGGLLYTFGHNYSHVFFKETAMPMLNAYLCHKRGYPVGSSGTIGPWGWQSTTIAPWDWQLACRDWLQKRVK